MRADEVMGLVNQVLAFYGWVEGPIPNEARAELDAAIRSLCTENERLAGELAKFKAQVLRFARWSADGVTYQCLLCDRGAFEWGKDAVIDHTPECLVRKS